MSCYNSGDKYPPALPNNLRVTVLLFAPNSCELLVSKRNKWRQRFLPRFIHPRETYSPDLCLTFVEDLLSETSDPSILDLRVAAEVMNDDLNPASPFYNQGKVRIIHLFASNESAMLQYPLPDGLEWMYGSDFCSVFGEDFETSIYRVQYAFEHSFLVLYCSLCPPPSVEGDNRRCLHSRTIETWRWLSSVVQPGTESAAHPMIRNEGVSSVVFVVPSGEERLYVKLSPLFCQERAITLAITKLMPDDSLDIVASNADVDCFVSREFMPRPDNSEQKLTNIQKLARMQLRSVPHVSALLESGVPDRSPATLLKRIDEYMSDPMLVQEMEEERLSVTSGKELLISACTRLVSSKIPLTLVHGDYVSHNAGFRSDVTQDEGVILFDWQFACIGHPFCDLKRRRTVGTTEQREYEAVWEKVVSLEEIERDMEDVAVVGPLMLFATTWEWRRRGDKTDFWLPFLPDLGAYPLIAMLQERLKDTSTTAS